MNISKQHIPAKKYTTKSHVHLVQNKKQATCLETLAGYFNRLGKSVAARGGTSFAIGWAWGQDYGAEHPFHTRFPDVR